MALEIGRVMGIPIALDYSWFVILFLLVWTIGFSVMPQQYPGLSELDYLFIGVLSALILFGSILLHELAHSVVARRNGLKIRRITLYLLGGVSEMEEEPRNPALELKMAAAGPMASLGVAAVLGLLWEASALTGASPLVQAPLQYLSLVNVVVAAFNLIPAFPMDGGRVLRSMIWRRNGDLLRSTRLAANVGRGFAYLLMMTGAVLAFAVDIVSGFWFFLIGWFISNSAQSALRQTVIEEDLRGLKTRDIMTGKVDSVSPEMTLDVLSEEFLRLKHSGFPVISESRTLEGCVTFDDLRKVPREAWTTTAVRNVMTPREKLVTVADDDTVVNAISLIRQNNIGRLFVLDSKGEITGVITRSDIIRTIELREGGLGMAGQPSGREREVSFTAEPGMNFVVQQPAEAGMEWRAEYSGDAVRLVAEETVSGEGGETKRFTFEATKRGAHTIRLLEVAGPQVGGGRRAGRPVRTVTYTVTVE